MQQTTKLVVEKTIDMPDIIVQPVGKVRHSYEPFKLDLSGLNLQSSDRELISHSLQTNQQITISSTLDRKYGRLTDYIVEHLADRDDIAYDDHANLLYDLAEQAVRYFRDTEQYSEDELHNIFFGYGKLLADHIHTQMTEHYREEADDYEVKVNAGFLLLKQAAYTTTQNQPIHDYRQTFKNVSDIKKTLFGGFTKCLYPLQKFDSDTERRFAILLERDAIKWFKPVSRQFRIIYRDGTEHRNYQSDFIAELDNEILMVETKARNELNDPVVQAKAQAAREYCRRANQYLQANNGKPWRYVLIPHDEVSEDRSVTDF